MAVRTRFEQSTVSDNDATGQAQPNAQKAIFTYPPYLLVGPVIQPVSTFPVAEQNLAQNPKTLATLAGGVSDFSNIHQGRNVTKVFMSEDNGVTWVEGFFPVDTNGLLPTSDGLAWEANSDPVVAFHQNGAVYVLSLFLNGVSNSLDNSNGIYVARTTPANATAIQPSNIIPVQVWSDPNTQFFGDKPWIQVDNTGKQFDGHVYVSWTRFFGNDNAVRFSRSVDGGQTYSAPVHLNPLSQNGHIQGTQVQIGPNGEVYVTWLYTNFGNNSQLWFIRSLDGGVTWRAPHQITGNFNTITVNSTYRVNSFPKMRVSDVDGSIHMLYPDQPTFALGKQMNYIRSTDGGVTFSNPITINDADAGDQFMPNIAIDQFGHVHACWYDTRNFSLGSQFIDVYASYSKSPGLWATNVKVNDTPIDLGTAVNNFIGDYSGLRAAAAIDNTVTAHPLWTSAGFNNGVLLTRILQVP
jgi:hypothetical protein